jgi:hypothetical protein
MQAVAGMKSLIAAGLLLLPPVLMVGCGGRTVVEAPAPTPSGEGQPPVAQATPPPGDVRVFLNTRPGARVDPRLLQEVAQAYSFLWPALFNALANVDDVPLQGVALPAAREALMGRARELEGRGLRLLVRSMRQQPLVMEAGGDRAVIEDQAQVEGELLAPGQEPGQGRTVQETWSFRSVWVRLPEGWRLQEVEVTWQG